MATGQTKIAITDNQPLGDTELQLLVDGAAGDNADAGEIAVRDASNRAFVVGPAVGLSYAAGTNFLSQTAISNRRYGGFWQSNWAAWDESDSGMSSVPFEDDGASLYYIGLRHSQVPITSTLKRSAALGHTYATVSQQLGFTTTIASVTNPVPAAGLLFTVTSNDLGPGFNNIADNRPATVWLVNPVTATSEAVYTGTVAWDGANLEVQATHYLGQTEGAHSVVVGDYVVFVHGMSINKVTDLSTVNDGSGQQIYLLLGTFNSATAALDLSGQVQAPSLGQLGPGAASVTSLVAAFRAGASIGGSETTRDWNDPSNVTVNSVPDPVTFTFVDPMVVATRDYIFSGINDGVTEPRLSQTVASGGLIATIAKSEATATYYVVAEVVDTAGAFEFRFTIVPAAGYTADQTRRLLRVYQFGFTTGTGVVATEVAFDLNLRRGIADGSLMTPVLDSAAGALAVRELLAATDNGSNRTMLSILARDTFGGTPFAVTPVVDVFRSSTDAGVQIWGEVGSGDMGVGDRASVIFGNDPKGGGNDYQITVAGGASPVMTGNYGAGNTNFFAHQRLLGEAVDTAGAFRVEDMQLIGTNGKLVWRQLGLAGGSGETQWSYDATTNRWATADAAVSRQLHIDIPASIMPVAVGGASTRITKIRMFGAVNGVGMGIGDAIRIDLIRLDMTTGNPPTVAQSASLANAVVDAGAGAGTLWGDFQEGAAAGAGEAIVADKRYFIDVSNDLSGGAATDWYLYAVWVQFRVFQGFPS